LISKNDYLSQNIKMKLSDLRKTWEDAGGGVEAATKLEGGKYLLPIWEKDHDDFCQKCDHGGGAMESHLSPNLFFKLCLFLGKSLSPTNIRIIFFRSSVKAHFSAATSVLRFVIRVVSTPLFEELPR
jgi:hypothetical protein